MSGRHCGGCTLCCRLLPVRSLGKGANQRCVHQRTGKGCAVYAKLGAVSPECVVWNCRWLVNADTGDLARPDRSHYVVDIMPDFIKVQDEATGEITEMPVVQVWVHPSYPDAHRDPALREWLNRHAELALVRYSAVDGFVLFPPSRTADGQWHQQGSVENSEPAHSVREIMRVLGSTQL